MVFVEFIVRSIVILSIDLREKKNIKIFHKWRRAATSENVVSISLITIWKVKNKQTYT